MTDTAVSAAEKPAATIETIVERYIALRDQKAVLKKKFDESTANIDAALDKIENFLLKRLQEQGADSIKTGAGTAYVSVKANASIGDRDLFKRFLSQQDDPFVFIDLKANKPAIEAFKNESGDLPPGVNWSEVRTVNIRRS